MAIFTKESLEALRNRIDLPDVLENFIELKRAGASFKALCPFHEEKSPSFVVQKGDSHYHCFGCGAHGDAIAFLMNNQRLSFSDAVEYLADKFQVTLEKTDAEESKGPSKKHLRDALEIASRLYHTLLLHTEDGHQAMKYLYQRGISLEFIKRFEIGYAPRDPAILTNVLKAKGVPFEIAEAAGLFSGGNTGRYRDFFVDRILFPIRAAAGNVIGFSGRKYKEETHGGKYINTPETPLFKKSRVLFGLNFSRQRIAKERRALIVEGQIDALRLIDVGLDFTVAGQGTAFGQEHVKELTGLGILTAYLAFDSDKAGQNAAVKVGELFQKEGVEVKIVQMPSGADPDSYIKEKGVEAFQTLLETAVDFLTFLVAYHAKTIDLNSPAGKNELATMLSKQIRNWDHPVMVHESLRKLAHLLKVPESMVGAGQELVHSVLLKKSSIAGHCELDPGWVIESDVLRWLWNASDQEKLFAIAKANLTPEAFRLPSCRMFYEALLQIERPKDHLSMLNLLDESEGQKLFEELSKKRINLEKAEEHFKDALRKLLDRNWMAEREMIRMQIQSGTQSDEEALELVKKFEAIKRSPPIMVA